MRMDGGAPLRCLPGKPRFTSLVPRIAIVRARSKFALLGRKTGKSRLFLPRSADSGFALRGRFLEKRLRVLAKTRQISLVLPSRFGPIWKSICASWRKPGRYARFTCASWEKHGTFTRFQGRDVPPRHVPSQRPFWLVSRPSQSDPTAGPPDRRATSPCAETCGQRRGRVGRPAPNGETRAEQRQPPQSLPASIGPASMGMVALIPRAEIPDRTNIPAQTTNIVFHCTTVGRSPRTKL
jgi:hypothetical protein